MNHHVKHSDIDLKSFLYVYTGCFSYPRLQLKCDPTSYEFSYPYGIVVNSKNQILVANKGASKILVFDSDFKFLHSVGSQKSLSMPYQLAVFPNDDIAVADFGASCLVVFSPDGTQLGKYSHPRLVSLSSVYVAKNNDIIVGT